MAPKKKTMKFFERLFDEYDLKNNNNNEVGYVQTSRILRRWLKCSIKQMETHKMWVELSLSVMLGENLQKVHTDELLNICSML